MTTPICAVSRASILTGQWERRHGVHDFDTPLSPAAFARTYPARMKAAGYVTGFVGKWGLGGPLPEREFDYWAGFGGQGLYWEPGKPDHLTPRQTEQAQSFLRTPAEPFCLSVSFKAPHAVDDAPRLFQPEPEDEALYAGVEIPRPRTATEEDFARQPEFIRRSEGHLRYLSRWTPALFGATARDYYRLVTGLDRAVGRLLATLEERGVAERTVVVFASDNGLFMGEHGLADKWLVHEESIRVPLIVRWPGLAASLRGRTVDAMVLNTDLAPTLLEAAGLEPDAETDGVSLVSLLLGSSEAPRKSFLYEHSFQVPGVVYIPEGLGVRTRRFTYVRYPKEGDPPYEQLFDLATDPWQENDLLHPTPGLPRALSADAVREEADRLRRELELSEQSFREAPETPAAPGMPARRP